MPRTSARRTVERRHYRVASFVVTTLLSALGATGLCASAALGSAQSNSHLSGGVPACSSLSLPLIQSTLGIRVTGPSASNQSSSRAIANFEDCQITTPGNPSSAVTINLKSGVPLRVFKSFRSLNYDMNGQPTTSLAGLGTGAFGVTQGVGVGLQSTVAVLKGATVMVISAPASLGKVKALARKLLPKI